jgi:cellulose synthase/poly-beta-1,6-N-acetylglucosamine synthase-like glycosyltransferase
MVVDLRPLRISKLPENARRHDETIRAGPEAFMMSRVFPLSRGIYRMGLQEEETDVQQYPKYSIVIPAYNESARIPATLRSVVDCIRARGWNAEVVVVNDGSRDNTAGVVREFAVDAPEVRLLALGGVGQ